MKRLIVFALSLVLVMSVFSVSASAQTIDSYNRIYKEGGAVSNVLSRECYTAEKQITASSLGIEDAFEGLNDIYAAKNGNVYILASDVSKIIVLNSNYELAKEIKITDENGDIVNISGARGIYADEDGTIYVADTINERVIKLDDNGKIELSLTLPDSDIIPEGFFYQPIKIVRDTDNYTYVLSEGCYYGALMYSPENVFEGFIGANNVEATALDALNYIIETLTSSDKKKAASVKTLPYSFLDFSIDKEGYIVTCTGSTDTNTNGKGQIRKINQSGSNILYMTDTNGDASSSSAFNFLEQKVFKKNNIPQRQNIVAIDIDDDGYIYALEETYGLIYVFDSDCNLIAGFGGGEGKGTQIGIFSKPVSLTVSGDSVLVADITTKTVTVFKLTEFGKTLKQADTLYIKGNYDDAAKLWEKVLESDRGNQLAYRGLAMTAYNDGDYNKALSLAKKGYDYNVYDMAYQRLFTDFIAKNFIWIFGVILALIGGFAYAFVTIKRKKIVIIKNAKLKTVLSAGIHPFRSFEEVKHYNRGSLLIATVILLLFFIVSVLKVSCSGFLFLKQSPDNYNILYTLAQTIGLVLLWTVSNWLISTLMSGKGKMEDIFIGTMYALVPYVIFIFIAFVFSWVLPLSAMGIVSGLQTVILIYTFFLLAVAMMQIHEYDFFRFLLTVLLTLFAMLFIVFLLFMIIILIQQFWNLIYAVFNEVVRR